MLPPSDWRALRCSSSGQLREPATEDEKLVWDYMLLPLEYKKGGCLKDFEDPDGHYSILGCTKTSSDEDIRQGYRNEVKHHRDTALQVHPDRSNRPNDGDAIRSLNARYERVQESFAILGSQADDGSRQNRVDYDKCGEEIRDLFKAAYDKKFGVSFEEGAALVRMEQDRGQIYEKRDATNISREAEGVLTKVCRLWSKGKGLQQKKSCA